MPLQPWFVPQFREHLSAEQFRSAVNDILDGLKRSPLWLSMGFRDILMRYRRSIVGPFWLTLSMAVLIVSLALLYSTIFSQPLEDYLPYVAAGFVVWGLISQLINDGALSFITSAYMLSQLPAPLSIYVYRDVWRNFLIFFHNIWIFIITALIFQLSPGWAVLAVVPGLVLILLNGVWLGLLLGLISARFRDVPQVIASIVQVAFFLTPIIWKPEMLPGRALVLDLNLFYHLVEVVRAPLLGIIPSASTYLSVIAFTLLGWGVTLLFYTVYRWRISYWV